MLLIDAHATAGFVALLSIAICVGGGLGVWWIGNTVAAWARRRGWLSEDAQ